MTTDTFNSIPHMLKHQMYGCIWGGGIPLGIDVSNMDSDKTDFDTLKLLMNTVSNHMGVFFFTWQRGLQTMCQ